MLYERYLVLGDAHIPFHSPKLINTDGTGLVLDVADDLGVDGIILAGDILDVYGVNRYGTSPSVVQKLQDELFAGHEFFGNLRKRFKKQKIVYLYGNHEARLAKYIETNAKPFNGLISIEKECRLKELDIEFYYYNYAYHLAGTNCVIQHSPPSYSQNAARTSLLKKMSGSFIWGCSHRPDSAYLTSYDGKNHEAHIMGWLGSTDLTDDHKEVFSYTKGHETWGHSFITIDILPNNFFINHHIIKNNSCVVGGNLYEA